MLKDVDEAKEEFYNILGSQLKEINEAVSELLIQAQNKDSLNYFANEVKSKTEQLRKYVEDFISQINSN